MENSGNPPKPLRYLRQKITRRKFGLFLGGLVTGVVAALNSKPKLNCRKAVIRVTTPADIVIKKGMIVSDYTGVRYRVTDFVHSNIDGKLAQFHRDYRVAEVEV